MMLPCFFRRLAETVFVPIIISILFGYIVKFIPSLRENPVIFTIFMCVCFFAVLVTLGYMLRSYFFFVKNTFDYFTVNFIAYLVAMIINLVVYFLCDNDVLARQVYEIGYFFYNFFCVFSVSVFPSTLFVHGIMILFIFLAPLELYSVVGRMNRRPKQ